MRGARVTRARSIRRIVAAATYRGRRERLPAAKNPLDKGVVDRANPGRARGYVGNDFGMGTIAVIGLGRLGLPMAVVAAAAGHRVIGVDRDPDLVRRIETGELDDREPGVGELRHAAGNAFQATTELAPAIRDGDISLIVVPTPADASAGYSNDYVLDAVGGIGAALAGSNRPHTVAVASTVMPGSCAGAILEELERRSGRRLGDGLALCYNPIFAALGGILRGYRNPDFVLIGESHPGAGDGIADLHRSIVRNAPPMMRVPLVDAELAKLALNSFVTTKIAFANMLAGIAAGLPGADIERVLGVLGRDRRIGPAFLTAAMPYGGPCFARDNRAMAALAARAGRPAEISAATEIANRRMLLELGDAVEAEVPDGGLVALLGLAFKAGTGVTEDSPALALAMRLLRGGRRVRGFDPAVSEAEMRAVGRLEPAPTLAAAVAGADAVVVANDDPVFSALEPGMLRNSGRKPVIFDYWRLLSAQKFAAAATIRHLGVGGRAATA